MIDIFKNKIQNKSDSGPAGILILHPQLPARPLHRMSGQESAERDWNAEVPSAQVKEQYPMEVVA